MFFLCSCPSNAGYVLAVENLCLFERLCCCLGQRRRHFQGSHAGHAFPSWSLTPHSSSHFAPSTPLLTLLTIVFTKTTCHTVMARLIKIWNASRPRIKTYTTATYLALGPTSRAATAVARLDKHGLIGSRPSQTSLTATVPTEDYSILFDEHANGSTRQFAQAALLSTTVGMRQWVWVSASV